MSAIPARMRRLTRVEYERMIDRGIFRDDERLELLDGVLVVKEPQGDPHAVGVDLVAEALRRVFRKGWLVRAHAPAALGRASRPEPDVSVVRGSARDYVHGSPRTAVLVVEVSQSSLRLDQTNKASIYARAGIADYWIVNLVHRVVEVRREPGRLGSREWGYRSIERLGPDAHVSPLAAPAARIRVADLLP